MTHILSPDIPAATQPRRMPLAERIAAHIETTPTGCQQWTGYVDPAGYGKIRVREDGRSRSFLAHRVSYEALVGPIPAGLVLDHLCRNRSCVNPEHLEPVTQSENCARARERRAIADPRKACIRGHAFDDPDLTYVDAAGRRHCRPCRAEAQRRFKATRGAKR